MNSTTLTRPGISSDTLLQSEIKHVTSTEAKELTGNPEPGILIPYHRWDGSGPLQDKSYDFYRLRLDKPSPKMKYYQPPGSKSHVYVPGTSGQQASRFKESNCDCLHLIEGEFKAISLLEALSNINDCHDAVVGLNGFWGFSNKAAESGLNIELEEIIAWAKPQSITFHGDADTALNPDFYKAALRLATCCQVPVNLVTVIRQDVKGLDDARDTGDFNVLDYLDNAIPVPKDIDLATLLGKQLDVWKSSLNGTYDIFLDENEYKASKCVLSLIGPKDLRRVQSKVKALGWRSPTMGHLRELVKEDRSEIGKKRVQEAVTQGDSSPIIKAASNYYPYRRETIYFKSESSGKYVGVDNRTISYRLKTHHDLNADESEFAWSWMQEHNQIQYADPLCGRPAGLHEENGLRMLVTGSPTYIEGKPNNEDILNLPQTKYILSLFAGDMAAVTNFIAWLKIARQAMRDYKNPHPGQALCFIGPKSCGKSLLMRFITHAMGGRYASGGPWVTAKSQYTDDMFQAEHLICDDIFQDQAPGFASKIAGRIKTLVANPTFEMEGKFKQRVSLRPIWRVSLSVNNTADSLGVMPALDPATEDKITLFRCEPRVDFEAFQHEYKERHPDFPFETVDYWDQHLGIGLPEWFHHIDNFEIPNSLKDPRWGIKSYHDPELKEDLEMAANHRQLAEMLISYMEDGNAIENMTGTELMRQLSQSGELIHTISRTAVHLGRMLRTLKEEMEELPAAKRPFTVELIRERTKRGWTIRLPDSNK